MFALKINAFIVFYLIGPISLPCSVWRRTELHVRRGVQGAAVAADTAASRCHRTSRARTGARLTTLLLATAQPFLVQEKPGPLIRLAVVVSYCWLRGRCLLKRD